MTQITHQDIVQRVEALAKERSAAYQKEMARIDAEHKSLHELCGGIGHIFAESRRHISGARCCLVCGRKEG